MTLEHDTRDSGERLAARRRFWEQAYLTLLTIRAASPQHKGGTITELAELTDRHLAEWDARWASGSTESSRPA